MAPPAVDEFRDFLQKIKEQVQVTDFIQVVGTDLLGAKVISAADFSTPPNSLQLAKLTRRIRESGIHIADIEVQPLRGLGGWRLRAAENTRIAHLALVGR